MTEYIEIPMGIASLETNTNKIYIDVKELEGLRVLSSIKYNDMYGDGRLPTRQYRGEKE